jgi:hypothetical protein
MVLRFTEPEQHVRCRGLQDRPAVCKWLRYWCEETSGSVRLVCPGRKSHDTVVILIALRGSQST